MKPEPLLSVPEAHARLIALFAPLPPEVVPLAQAAGRVLARDAVARRDQPPFPASAMDGYAVRAGDVRTGARLRVIGVAQAGRRYDGEVGPGEAVRIYTGAPVPPGADAVVIQEDVEVTEDHVLVKEGRDATDHVRPAGGDFRAGFALAAPRRLNPAEIALLAGMNVPTVAVVRRPVVAIIPTGDELVPVGEAPGPDEILASSNHGLKAMLEAAGAEARLLPIARDTPEDLVAALALAEDADMVVTLGGASVGDFDLVRRTALAHGLRLEFYKIAMRPGKPLLAGRFGDRVLVGLPGNPVSAMVCGRIFLVPAVDRLLGLEGAQPPIEVAVLEVALPPNGPRAHYMRAWVAGRTGGWRCRPFDRQDSSLLSALAAANALLVRPPLDEARGQGDLVEFIWF